ncbi:MAG: protein kinase [Deltaproteobacteria bacterium]|nr:protein kinase [Deltaproteobacteria bacterium]
MQRRIFELHACVGRGGFGEVYRATMRSPGGLVREVAVKMLKRDVAPDEDAVQRLRYEANLLARLDHRAILNVVDMVNLAGRVCMVTQYLDGDDLLRCVQGAEPITERGLVELCGEVAGALHATATNLELVHRDIKPSNIRVTLDGTVKLLDFGIARSDKVERDGHTHTGMVVGTPGYIAPERFLDDAVTPACDIYSLGCVVYAGLTQQRLHQDLSRKRLLQLALDPAEHQLLIEQRLREVRNDGLRHLLAAMLQHEPEARPKARRVEELCEDLAPRCTGKPLRRWARERTWPAPPSEHGEMVGQIIEEEALVAEDGPNSRVAAAALSLPSGLGGLSTRMERLTHADTLAPIPAPQLGPARGLSPTAPPPFQAPSGGPTVSPVTGAPPGVAAQGGTPVAQPPRLAPPTPPPPLRAPPAHGGQASSSGMTAQTSSLNGPPTAPPVAAPRGPGPAAPTAGFGVGPTAATGQTSAAPRSTTAPRAQPPPSGGAGRFFAPVIVLGLGALMYGFLAMEGHVPPPKDLILLAQAAVNDARVAWKHRDER